MIEVKESASEAVINDIPVDDNSIVASQISLNTKGEWDAIEGYNKLIALLTKVEDTEAIEVIREIVSDEKNHAERLAELVEKYDSIESAID